MIIYSKLLALFKPDCPASYSAFKIRREHFHVALLPTILKTKQETTHDLNFLRFVNSYVT